jgi:hypothetical protein
MLYASQARQTRIVEWVNGEREPVPGGIGWERVGRIQEINDGKLRQTWGRPMPSGIARVSDLLYRVTLGHPDSMRAALVRTARCLFFCRHPDR